MKKLESWLRGLISTKWCGNNIVPLDHETFRRGERVAKFTNDAFSIGVGTADEWIYIFDRDEFQAMALWYLWCWAFKEWFGLRRKLWYWLLHREVKRWRAAQVPSASNSYVSGVAGVAKKGGAQP